MLKGMNRLAMLTLVTLGMTSVGSMAAAGKGKLTFERVTDAHFRYRNLTAFGKKAIGEHMMIWNTKKDHLKYKDDSGLSYYIDPDSSLKGGTYTELKAFGNGQVQQKRIILPDSEIQAKEIFVDQNYVKGFTRVFDSPTGEIHVHEVYTVKESKLGTFRRQTDYRREQNGFWGTVSLDGNFRRLYVEIGQKSKITEKDGNIFLPATVPGNIHGFKINGEFSRVKIYVLDDSGSKPVITEYEYQIISQEDGYSFKALDNSRKLSVSEVNSFKALNKITEFREATQAKEKSANGMTQEVVRKVGQ